MCSNRSQCINQIFARKGNKIKKDFYTLPQAMYNLDGIKPILKHGTNAILHKILDRSMLNAEKIIVSHSIVYVKKGRVKVATYDYDEVEISDGEILFMPRDSYLISDYVKENENMEVYLFFFDHTLTSEFLKNIHIQQTNSTIKKNNILKLKPSTNMLHYIISLDTVEYENIENKHLLYVKLFEFLHLIYEANHFFAEVLFQEEMKSHNRDIETYMLEHYDKNLTISDWAVLSGVSVSTFNRKFKKLYGVSPKKWILKQNMLIAYGMLKNGMSVSKCAEEFNYNNTSNFIKTYKDIHHLTPKQHISLSD
jgi:AraC-like DNA-binding protein